MTHSKLIRIRGFVLASSAVLILAWYSLMGLLLPFREISETFLVMVRDKDWVWVNTIGLLGFLFLVLGLTGMYSIQIEELKKLGLTGFVITMLGAILHTCIQFIETFIWPLLAVHAPNLLYVKGEMFADKAFGTAYLLVGFIWVIGFILYGIASLRAKVLPKPAVILFSLGAAIFGAAVSLIYVRLAGCVMFTAGAIWIGIAMANKE